MDIISVKPSKNSIEKTYMLLDRYTTAKWFVDQGKRLLQREYLFESTAENDVINQVDAAELYDNRFQQQFAATLRFNKEIIHFIDFAIQALKDAPNGPTLFTVIQVIYLEKETKGRTMNELLPEVANRMVEERYKNLAPRTFERLKKEAIEILAFILFSTSTELRECIDNLLKEQI